MFAIVNIGGHQHKITKDQIFLTELTGAEAGSEFECKEVLMLGKESDVKVGAPYVNGATVKLKVLDNIKGPKLYGFTYKKRTGTQKTWGHRQNFHKLQVLEIKG